MSVVEPKGFLATGIASGIKASGELDIAVVVSSSGEAIPTAATFTTNKAAAAPVVVSKEHLRTSGGMAQAVIISSGNANAATGSYGERVARTMTTLVAEELGIDPELVLVCSTGLIGIPLPLEPIQEGVPKAMSNLSDSSESGALAARALMTTDTFAKVEVRHVGGYTIGAMAKGAAMISPNMATMLAVITTDAKVSPQRLQMALFGAVDPTFNRLSIDGCTSTNDTVIAMASGASMIEAGPEFEETLLEVCQCLADKIASDAEGGSKVVKVHVRGALSDAEALVGARKIAESQLVKCSFLGEDPYWGRVASELGSAGIAFELNKLDVAYQGVVVARGGDAVPFDAKSLAQAMASDTLKLEATLGVGVGAAVVTTVDLGYGYIDENKGTS